MKSSKKTSKERTSEVVDRMVVSLISGLIHNPRFLEEELLCAAANNASVGIEVRDNELAESRGVVVPHRFCISKGF